ncbi:Uncharacterized protein FKW44_008012 [Caligus rogercresseyi]|uniref:Uncharacterized protein n=1 Tax=Caligus rogercresseyi TaxID=217165 RepID=A0A7T8KFI8_CALRO|nr:Uncharacterized protein FKW44_008012 [Caligus rogercresseyi]
MSGKQIKPPPFMHHPSQGPAPHRTASLFGLWHPAHWGQRRSRQDQLLPPAPVPLVSKRVCSRWDDRSGRLHLSKLSREERRELFALRVQTQEDEKKRRELLLEHHRNKCFYLNLPAEKTPLFPHYPSFVFNPEDGNWYQMPEPYPKVIVSWGYADMATDLPPEAYREGDEPLPDRGLLYPPGIVPVSYLYGIPLTTPEDYYRQQQAILQQTRLHRPYSDRTNHQP